MDLKALLIEAKQKVPPVLQVLQTGDETMLDIGGTNYILVVEMPDKHIVATFTCLCKEALRWSKVQDKGIFNFCFSIPRRERLYILWWFGPQDHRLSQVGGYADKTGHQYRPQRLPGQQLHGFLMLCTPLSSHLSLREASVSCFMSFCTKCIIHGTVHCFCFFYSFQ